MKIEKRQANTEYTLTLNNIEITSLVCALSFFIKEQLGMGLIKAKAEIILSTIKEVTRDQS